MRAGEGTPPKNGCHPVTLSSCQPSKPPVMVKSTDGFHSNPVPLKMALEPYESTGSGETVPLNRTADFDARRRSHSTTLPLEQGDNGMSPCHPAVTLGFDFATQLFCT